LHLGGFAQHTVDKSLRTVNIHASEDPIYSCFSQLLE